MRQHQERKAWNTRTRWLILLAAVLLLILTLTACTPRSDAGGSLESVSPAPETVAAAPEAGPSGTASATEETQAADPVNEYVDETVAKSDEATDVNTSPKEETVEALVVEDEVKPLPRLVDLGAGKCIPCKEMAPIIEELAETKKEYFEVVFFDVWENPDIAGQYGVRIIPTQIFDSADGTELYRHVGFYSREQILDKWRELGIDVGE